MAFHPVLAAFVGNNAWFGVLIVLHVFGAVVGLGPTFAFAILGPMAGKVPPEGSVALMESIVKIEDAMVVPILTTIQPITGVLIIWNRGLNNNFFSSGRLWLIAGIVLYIVALGIATGIQTPSIKKMIGMAKSGEAMKPEFGALVKRTSTLGPVLTILGLAIVILMVWKPGSHCLYQC